MLSKQSIPTPVAGVHTNRQAPTGKPIKTVSGQFIARAKVHYAPRRRAEDAARWLRGELTIKPTLKLAAETFGVSIPLVVEAREHHLRRLAQREQGKRHLNGGSVPGLSDDAVERIVAEVGVERIWRAVDKITQPNLPLVAAE
jgi:hypothetical protein